MAGLWSLRTLLDAGYDAALVETRALGAGQTIASQGIVHAGTKYALRGEATLASKAAGDAAAIWRHALGIRTDSDRRARDRSESPHAAPPDLRGVPVLSRHTHLFTTPAVGSRLAGLAASKALAIGPRRLGREEAPTPFDRAPAGVQVYRLDEPVLDLPALLKALAEPVRERLILARDVRLAWEGDGDGPELRDGRRVLVRLAVGDREVVVRPRMVVCAAGSGNKGLLGQVGLENDLQMQRRPLHMVMARGNLPEVWAHCVGFSDKPRVTITTTRDARGRAVWYVGGQAAEQGVGREREAQVDAVRAEVRAVAPWIDVSGAEWTAFAIDRAEGFDSAGRRPDRPVVRARGRVIACWPTKLVLAPLAAGAVLEAVGRHAPSGGRAGVIEAPRPEVATPIWERDDLVWS